MPWRWGPPNGRHSCLGLIASPPYSGRRVFSAFIDTASPLLLYPRRSSLLNRPAFLYDRRGDFFLPWLGHSIFELAITARCVSPCPRRSHLPVRASCGFWGFHMGPSPRACLPAPPLIRLALTRHASRDVIVPSPRSSSRLARPHRPSPRPPTR